MTHSKQRHAVAKPRRDFPLWKHPSGRWCKKCRGRAHYFGKVADDPDGTKALDEWLRVKDDLLAGREPAAKTSRGPSVADLCSDFLEAKEHLAETGELSRRTFRDYHYTCQRMVDVFGKNRLVADLGPADFLKLKSKMAETLSLLSMTTEIRKSRAVFNWAADEDTRLIERLPQFGREFRPPNAKALARAKRTNGNARRIFEAEEIRRLIGAAGCPFKAILLLGVNCGFGNMDCATLPLDALDWGSGWVDHPRPKTGVERRCPLWPETIEALREALDKRRKPRDAADKHLVFLTQSGRPWVRLSKKEGSDSWHDAGWTDSVQCMMNDLVKRLGLKKRGRGFYALRHVFETVGGGSRDQVAVDRIMGHVTPGMGTVYREGIEDDRLQAVADHVHGWLFGGKSGE